MNKVTQITLQRDMVVIWRGATINRKYYTDKITDASRIRLNDILAVWSKESKIESRPYVGPGWHTTNLYVVDVPKIKKNANAGKLAEDLDRIQGINGLASAILYSNNDAEALRESIGNARSQLIQLMIVLREIEKES